MIIALEHVIMNTSLGDNERLSKGIAALGSFIALIAAVIALSNADPKKLFIKFKISSIIDETEPWAEYRKEKLSNELKEFFKEAPDPFYSFKVNFKITNTSGITWKHPTITFRLPISNEHPRDDYSGLAFNSNMYNSTVEVRFLQFEDTLLLSNSNLPYWNNEDSAVFWVRMVIYKDVDLDVSVNCDNAEGVTKKVKVSALKDRI